MKLILRFFLLLSFEAFCHSIVFPQSLQSNFWQTDGPVYSSYADTYHQRIYIGGNFNYVGLYSPYGAGIDSATRHPDPALPGVNGVINVVTADGSGGWFIGGGFTTVGGVTRNRIAHIRSDKTVDSWNPNASDSVFAILVSGGTIYVSGKFTTIGGQTRNHIAALNATSGSATNWNPNADGPVYAMAAADTFIYLGGNFWHIGNQISSNFVRVDTSDGVVDPSWLYQQGTNLQVYGITGIAVSSSSVYIVGDFTHVFGGGLDSNQYFIAALNKSTGALRSWNPNSNGSGSRFCALSLSGGTVYAGGDFGNYALEQGHSLRHNIAAFDTGTGIETTWDPDADGTVRSIQIVGSTVYFGGDFTHVGGQSHSKIAAVDISTGSPLPTADASGSVNSIAVSGTTMYVGGSFTLVGRARSSLASIDAASGIATEWNPVSTNTNYYSIAAAGPSVFAATGGSLTKFDTTTGAVINWPGDPIPNDAIYSLVVAGTRLYAGGNFTTIGGQNRNRIAALDTATGNVTSWDPNPNEYSSVTALAAKGTNMYVAGQFTSIGGQTRNSIAALDTGTGNATSWDPNASGGGMGTTVYGIAIADSTMYIGGDFGTIGDSSRARLAELSLSTGTAKAWNPGADAIVQSITCSGSSVYAAGQFATAGGQSRSYVAALDRTSGNATSWNPNPNNLVKSVAALQSQSKVYLGGQFTGILSASIPYLAALDDPYNSSLPVELTSFSGIASGPSVELSWKTATEIQNAGFEIERSISNEQSTANNWAKIGFVDGAGTSNAPHSYSFTDKVGTAGAFSYRLKQIDRNGAFTYSQTVTINVGSTPRVFSLDQNYPNPFNPSTTIQFTVPEDGRTTLKIFNTIGQEVTTLFNGEAAAGISHQVVFNATNYASGIYFSRLEFNGKTAMKKMLLIK